MLKMNGLQEKIHWAFSHGIVMAFDKAVQLGPVFNKLMHRVAHDHTWLSKCLSKAAISDEFTNKLLEIACTVRQEGIRQKYCLGIHRSDYMQHSAANDSRNLLQVEINTIASSFGALSTKISEMHRSFNDMNASKWTVPVNNALSGIASAIATAHAEFCRQTSSAESIVLLVVQPNERNFSDQRLVQFEISTTHGVKCMRATLRDVQEHSTLSPEHGHLMFEGHVVSVVYFRAGYTPKDHSCPEEWEGRLVIERSSAIKCPNINYHLAGSKKVQQALAAPGVLEYFLGTDEGATAEIALLRSVFAGLYSLDVDDDSASDCAGAAVGHVNNVETIKERVIARPDLFVMKPQREGGGNNLYNTEMVQALHAMTAQELAAHIIMEKIQPPEQGAVMVRDCQTLQTQCVCELGIFSTYLADEAGHVLLNEYAGHLLRVKSLH